MPQLAVPIRVEQPDDARAAPADLALEYDVVASAARQRRLSAGCNILPRTDLNGRLDEARFSTFAVINN